jgi:hypothetical protein
MLSCWLESSRSSRNTVPTLKAAVPPVNERVQFQLKKKNARIRE